MAIPPRRSTCRRRRALEPWCHYPSQPDRILHPLSAKPFVRVSGQAGVRTERAERVPGGGSVQVESRGVEPKDRGAEEKLRSKRFTALMGNLSIEEGAEAHCPLRSGGPG